MTIANAAILTGLARLTLAVTPHPSNPDIPAIAEADSEREPCADLLSSVHCLPTFYTISCFDRDDRDDCLQTELEDQAVAYSTGVEVYHRPIRIRQLPEPVHWKTMAPPFECHVRL